MTVNNDNKGSNQGSYHFAPATFEITQSDIAQMSLSEMKKLIQDFQLYQEGLKLQNEEQRANQLQLSSSLERFKKLFDCAPVGFILLNTQGRITQVNLATCELLEHTKIQLKGTKPVDYIHPKDQDRYYLFFKSLLISAQKKSIEARIKTVSGGFISVVCQGCSNYSNDPDNSENEILLTFQEISKQKKTEQEFFQLNEALQKKVTEQSSVLSSHFEQLRENINEINESKYQLVEKEAMLNSVFSAAVEGIITINEKGTIQSVNKAVTKMFDYQADELIGHNVNKLMPFPHREQHHQYLKNYILTDKAKIIGSIRELEGQKKDGSSLPIDLSISEYKIGGQRFFTGMIRDVSERKRKEQMDKLHLDELAHVTRMGLMGEMASGIAHEVNQPLAAIATYSQVCLRILNNDNPDLVSLQDVLQKTEKQALRAGQIISRMREFISSDTIHRATVDINELIKDAVSMAYDECKQSSIECVLGFAESLPSISADAIQIEQVILNLIKNSIDVLNKLPQNKKRVLSIQTYFIKDRKKIEVRVKDNGPGIDEALQTLVFTPFFSTKERGMGMGLSICQSLITAHGGKLRFNSTTNKGSTFYFTLPVQKDSNGNN